MKHILYSANNTSQLGVLKNIFIKTFLMKIFYVKRAKYENLMRTK